MDYRLGEKDGKQYVDCLARVESEKDALDLVAACGENRVQTLMLHAENLPQEFYDLRTGLAGEVLQKFVTYYLRVAAVLNPELVNQHERFREMVREANRGSHFRVYYTVEEAESWLLNP